MGHYSSSYEADEQERIERLRGNIVAFVNEAPDSKVELLHRLLYHLDDLQVARHFFKWLAE